MDIASTPSSSASLRIESASIPPLSASAMAARNTRSLLSGCRVPGAVCVSRAIFFNVLLTTLRRKAILHRKGDDARVRSEILQLGRKLVSMVKNTTMKAVVRERYGPPDVLELKDVEKPTLDDDSLLVRVRAASLNAYDWHMLRGSPYLVRMMSGLRKPRSSAMGVDVAGEIEAVGKNVTRFQPGDAVFGSRTGSLAE